MELGKELLLLGHASFLLRHSGKNIYIDPFMLPPTTTKADLIIITHGHYDHWNPADIEKIYKPATEIICSKLCDGSEKYKNLTVMSPGESKEVMGLKIDATRAYNIAPEKIAFHPKGNDWLGYVIEVDGRRIYHAGDTDFIPEMKSLKNIYAALLPMGGHYTMEVNEMIEAARAIGADYTVPIHYRRLLGDKARESEKKLKAAIDKTVILEEVKP
jgi:L-ascorbate metabolism protein UlaG (beta-lactamase superfamily)